MEDPNKTVTLPAAEWAAMQGTVAALQQQVASGQGGLNPEQQARLAAKIAAVKNVNVRIVDGKVVTDFANRGTEDRPSYTYEGPHPLKPSERVLYVDVVLEGDPTPLRLEYLDLLRDSETRAAKVVRRIDEPFKVEYGAVERRELAPEGQGNGMVGTGQYVMSEAKGFNSDFVVEVDGREVRVAGRAVNI